jgi:hypothetical protein
VFRELGNLKIEQQLRDNSLVSSDLRNSDGTLCFWAFKVMKGGGRGL